jgi:hypothetical protein
VLQDLRIDVPELEPDPVLLARLGQLSASSVPNRREGPVRALVAGVTVLVLASFSWLTGALPGVASPFDGVRDHRPAPSHAPRTPPASGPASDAGSELPGQPAVLPPGQTRTHHDQGNHTGLTKPGHHDHGHHTGLIDAQHDQGHHYGQTKPHVNHGHHTGQTKPHANHAGQTKPHVDHGHHTGQTGTGQGNENGNGHHT